MPAAWWSRRASSSGRWSADVVQPHLNVFRRCRCPRCSSPRDLSCFVFVVVALVYLNACVWVSDSGTAPAKARFESLVVVHHNTKIRNRIDGSLRSESEETCVHERCACLVFWNTAFVQSNNKHMLFLKDPERMFHYS